MQRVGSAGVAACPVWLRTHSTPACAACAALATCRPAVLLPHCSPLHICCRRRPRLAGLGIWPAPAAQATSDGGGDLAAARGRAGSAAAAAAAIVNPSAGWLRAADRRWGAHAGAAQVGAVPVPVSQQLTGSAAQLMRVSGRPPTACTRLAQPDASLPGASAKQRFSVFSVPGLWVLFAGRILQACSLHWQPERGHAAGTPV